MEKLRIKRNDLYEIEVNDNGDTILFDLGDIELPLKFQKCLEQFEKIKEKIKAKEVVLSKKEDVKKGYFLTESEKELILFTKDMYMEMRKAFDMFLGEGACQKIFGDNNWTTMFDDFLEALAPHLEKMKLTQDKVNETIVNKYSKINDGELK